MKNSKSSRSWSCMPIRAAIAGTVLAVAAPNILAATITVDSISDSAATDTGVCTLRNAIRSANSNTETGSCVAGDDANDTIVFADNIANSTITLAGTQLTQVPQNTTLVIGAALADGSESNGITIDANNSSRIFSSFGNLTLNGLTLINGVGLAGVGGGEQASSGGAVQLLSEAVLTVNGGAMNNNTAVSGGAIALTSGENSLRITLNNVDFSGN